MPPAEAVPLSDAAAETMTTDDAVAAEMGRLRAENAALVARVAELERRLELNSSNSSKPPSSDGPDKPPRELRTRKPARGEGQGERRAEGA